MSKEEQSATQVDNVNQSRETEDRISAEDIKSTEEERFSTSLMGVGIIREHFSLQFGRKNTNNYANMMRFNAGNLGRCLSIDKFTMVTEFDSLRHELKNSQPNEYKEIIDDYLNTLLTRCSSAPVIKTESAVVKFRIEALIAGYNTKDIVIEDVFKWVHNLSDGGNWKEVIE